jgi:hypothetical protein
MKKVSIVLFVLFFAAMTHSFAQTAVATTPSATPTKAATADFFVGKWEISILGTPNGDAKMVANFTRKDGTLIGEMSDPTDAQKDKIPVSKIEEETDKITIYFTAAGYDLSIPFEKVDDDNMKGMLMNMFESKAVRIKE